MERIRLSSWRTLVWSRGVLAIFGLVGLIPLTVIVFFPHRFDWFGRPPPWYAALIVLAFVVAVLGFVARSIGALHPVAVDGTRVFVRKWLGEAVYPLSAVHAFRVERERSIGGQNPVAIELSHAGETEVVSFLLSEALDHGDVARLLGLSGSADRDRRRPDSRSAVSDSELP